MSKLKFGGYRFVRANPESALYQPAPKVTPPRKVDLRKLMTPVEDQGGLQSCTANAIAGAYEYLIKKHSGQHLDLSRLFIYYNARWRNGEQHEDAGSVIQYGMESLKSFGACNEKTWPYDEEAVLQKPKKVSYSEAERLKVLDMQQVGVDLDHWRHCLAEGYPIVFGCATFESFDDCNKRQGVVPMPDPNEVARSEHGLHAMLCVGYSDIDKVFIVRNSWGADWGDRGYCYMPFNYLMSEKLNTGDSWMMRGEVDLPDPDRTWVDNDHPLIRGVDSEELNRFTTDAYDVIHRVLVEQDDYNAEPPADFVALAETLSDIGAFVKESFATHEEEDESEEEEQDEEESDEEDEDASEDDEESDDEEDDEDDGDEEDDDEENDEDEEGDDEDEEEDEDVEDDEEHDEESEDDEEEDEEEDEDEDDEEDDEEEDDSDDEDDEEDDDEDDSDDDDDSDDE